SPAARAFWSSYLAGATAGTLPMLGADGDEPLETGGTLAVALEPEAGALRALAVRLGVPLKTLLLAGHLKVMAAIGGHDDVVTGYVSNGRLEQHDGERALGLFLNSVPFRQALADGRWRDLVAQVFKNEQAVIRERRFPLTDIQRLHGGGALFDTLFNFVHF